MYLFLYSSQIYIHYNNFDINQIKSSIHGNKTSYYHYYQQQQKKRVAITIFSRHANMYVF